ncbi:expressed unknown protein [Seminavis robusta]|uniref:Uncharacterized protein n=2 Tax=Seminavis robusta TaxID=568900 RepID=A0A9N8ESC0_9STRA|nr:expressed unknown protein [Seminavis robusta]|eukprot:Sro1738_g294530.1 n/a (569) ;mRNA; f:13393-15293
MRILLAPLLLAALAHANKDSTYYNNGVTNPNVEQAMYWHEGWNVLEDLSQFDKLYVTYHHCAWEAPTGDDDNGDGGGDGDDWYLNSVPSFRANVAYSLYGILKGQKDSGCNKKTYINSFHTTQGLESFTNSMAAAGLTNLFELVDGDEDEDDGLGGGTVTSTCYQDEDEDNEGDDNVNNGQKLYQSTSYGLGCLSDGSSSSKDFAIHTYDGGYCDANSITGTVDELEDLNERLDLAKCVPIFEGGYYDAEEQDDEDVDPLDVLATSRACRIHDGTKSCPDPYGQLKQRERQLNQATGALYAGPFWTARKVMITAWTMIAVGIFSFLSAIAWAVNDYMDDRTGGTKSRKVQEDTDSVMDPVKPSRGRSELSETLSSVASTISKSLGLTSDSHSKSSKNSKRSKRSSKSNKSKRSGRSGGSRRSKRSSGGGGNDDVDAPETINFSPSYRSENTDTSNLSAEDVVLNNNNNNIQDGVEAAPSTEDASVQASVREAVGDMVHFLKKTSETFFDEPEDEVIENKGIPDELPKPSSSRRVPSEAEVDSNWTEKEEAVSKKKWRKRRWFKKMLGK